MPKRRRSLNTLNVFLILLIALLGGALLTGDRVPQISGASLACAGTDSYVVSMHVPAVDQDGRGAATELEVETVKGSGDTLANIDVLLFWTDTQESIQTAKKVASEITGINPDGVDMIYAVKARNTTIVGGPSAGAALTIATVGALEKRQPSPDVMITGTINADHSIGHVGGVLEKAQAAKSVGAKIFLVPVGESVDTMVVPQESCTKEDGFVYCEKTYQKRVVNIGEEVGIDVREVSTISEALPYFFP